MAATAARAEWPADHPIQVFVGFAAGGGTDTMARTMAPFIQRHLGANASLVVQNKPGAAERDLEHQPDALGPGWLHHRRGQPACHGVRAALQRRRISIRPGCNW
ncbi:hypothetical protein ACU4GD_00030 [Cupriavidus basilensis]